VERSALSGLPRSSRNALFDIADQPTAAGAELLHEGEHWDHSRRAQQDRR
jgi:hypothetical protein